jgi:hypothetical protein
MTLCVENRIGKAYSILHRQTSDRQKAEQSMASDLATPFEAAGRDSDTRGKVYYIASSLCTRLIGYLDPPSAHRQSYY